MSEPSKIVIDQPVCQFCGEEKLLERCYLDTRADGKPILACDACHWETCPKQGLCAPDLAFVSTLDDIMTLVDGDGLEAVTEAKYQLKQLMLELIGELEQTPEAFRDWQNYTAESPTVREHYRNELKAQLTPQGGGAMNIDDQIALFLDHVRYDDERPLKAGEKTHAEELTAMLREAEHKGRHAEVVKALFLMESIPGYDVKSWLQERLSKLKQESKA